jgi:hypothetical protein
MADALLIFKDGTEQHFSVVIPNPPWLCWPIRPEPLVSANPSRLLFPLKREIQLIRDDESLEACPIYREK